MEQFYSSSPKSFLLPCQGVPKWIQNIFRYDQSSAVVPFMPVSQKDLREATAINNYLQATIFQMAHDLYFLLNGSIMNV